MLAPVGLAMGRLRWFEMMTIILPRVLHGPPIVRRQRHRHPASAATSGAVAISKSCSQRSLLGSWVKGRVNRGERSVL
jgi:hypothetical protein